MQMEIGASTPGEDNGEHVRAAVAADFRRIFESSPGLYLILGADMRILAVTDAYLEATMTVREEIIGRDIFDVFPDNPDDLDATGEGNLRASINRAVATREPDSMAVQRYDVRKPETLGGEFETRYWSPINTPVLAADGSLLHIVHQVEDVTEFVNFQAESELSVESNSRHRTDVESMHADVLRRSGELQDSNVQLRAASEAKNVFLSRMSHELRSPLTAVIGYSELLQLDVRPGSDEMHSADAILRAGTHLLELINEVLDISRIESGHMSLSVVPVPLENSLAAALDLMRPLAARREITITEPIAPSALFVSADHQRLTQVLINLISNAIKYNVGGGRISITVRESPDETVQIAVRDTGVGIPPENIAGLFRPFERLGAESTDVEGTGLGLSLSRGLAEEMGGSIEVESEVGVGSTFTVMLRVVQPDMFTRPDGVEPAQFSVVEYAGPRKVLYIEDTVANIQLVERMFDRRPQVTIIPAMLGTLGLDLAREQLPDLVLLDLHLPDVNGAEILRRLKADPQTEAIPVVILSADATNRQTDEVLELGAERYVTKPIRLAELLQLLDDFLLN